MRIVLTGGGTGGHIYPALAVAKEILRKEPQAAFLYIGTEKGLEADIVRRAGIPFQSIEIAGFKRKLSFDNVRTVWKFIRAVGRSKELIRAFQPDVVIGTGGYVCGPVVYAAAKLGVKTVIHEQNVVPGLANHFLSRYVNHVAVSFQESFAHFPKAKTVLTGNPCATQVLHGNARAGQESLGLTADKRLVLITSGSRGARAINEATISLLPTIDHYNQHHFVFVTGDVHYETISNQLKNKALPANLTVLPYAHNMADLLAASDLVISRAGASILAELTALGVPSILVPSPYVTNNHQEKNARGLENAGAAVVITEQQLNGERLHQAINGILLDPQRQQQMRASSAALGMPDAAERIYRLLANQSV
ncbi:MAG: undecaprenyldiphospho-muramoylpentapeptide beta-N-acetylglucosaminyltransferase [Clostridia bacterium]